MSRGVGVVGIPVARVAERAVDPGFAHFPKIVEVAASVGLVADVTPHTAGAWTEMIAATAQDANWLLVSISGTSSTGNDARALVDIGFGAGAAEVLKISSLGAGSLTAVSTAAPVPPTTYVIPFFTPKGTRVAARLRALITVDTADVVVKLATGSGLRGPVIVDTYGADTAASRGTNMPTSDTYVQLTAATAQAYRALVLMPTGGSGSFANETSTYTLAVGAGGAEVAVGTMRVLTGTSEVIAAIDGTPSIFPGHYPKGIRIACKQSIGRTYRDAIVLGIPYP